MPAMDAQLKLGVDCLSQYVEWSQYLEMMQLADRLGYDSLWTADHLLPVSGELDGPVLEPYLSLAAVAANTIRATLGLLVSPISMRHPALMAKSITTLDHISGGRAVLGVGAGWNAIEHEQYGLEFGSDQERLRWLREALPVIRGMLDDSRPSSAGDHFDVREIINRPLPVQERLPILVGGAGPKVTLRLVAEHADMCNFMGHPEFVAQREALLVEHCHEVGRDEREIERSVLLRTAVIRDEAQEAERVRTAIFEHHGVGRVLPIDFAGTPEAFVEFCGRYLELGYRHLIFGVLAPYDVESVERIATEIRPKLEALTN